MYIMSYIFVFIELDEDIDGVLQRLESHNGVDRALLQAKLWSKYVKEVITYVEKKNALGTIV